MPGATLGAVLAALALVLDGRSAGVPAAASSLVDLGVDSIARIEVAEVLEAGHAERLPAGWRIPDDELAAVATPAELAAVLAGALSAARTAAVGAGAVAPAA